MEEEEATREERDEATGPQPPLDDSEGERRKLYVDGGAVEIAAHLVYELDPDGKKLQVKKFTD